MSAVTAATVFAGIGAAAAVASATGVFGGKPKVPDAPSAIAPPQASRAPDAAAMRRKGTALTGPAAGNASTFLTGASGIEDASLNLGKNTLLGQ